MAKGGGPGSKLGGQSEVAPLKRVLLKHPQDAFRSFVVITEEWEQLGYLRRPELGKAINEFDRFVGILESLGARVDFLPPDPETSLDSIYVRGRVEIRSVHVPRLAIAKRASDHLP